MSLRIVIGCCALLAALPGRPAGAADAQPKRSARSASGISTRGASRPQSPVPEAEVRDAVLMLDDGPLHVRFHLSLKGHSLTEARRHYIDRLVESLDGDGDGQLTREEADRSPLLRKPRRERARKFLASLGVKRTVDREKIRETVIRVGGNTTVYRQDGSSAETDMQVFEVLDVDGNGILDSTEIAQAAARIEELDQDHDGCVSFREFLPPQEEPRFGVVPVNRSSPEDRRAPTPTVADLLRDARQPLLPRRLIEKYDWDGDRRLSARELNWSSRQVEVLDRNGDGVLDPRELARIEASPVDLEVAVELAPDGSEEPALQILSTRGGRVDPAERPNFARIEFPAAVLTVSYRHVDPIPAAIENAMREFNRLDVDGNGYLARRETSERIRFERGLFEVMDADGDGKIFGGEMEQYVAVRGEPAATSCRINVYDMGRGFFQTLDSNGDGRISIRERREIEQSLQSMQRSESPGLSPEEATRHFHIEFVRGRFQLFGRADQMIARTPTFETFVPIGPVWFQRMDRNTDGDLTWEEFLGPRDVFHRLDGDADRLIDPDEAKLAEQD